MIVIIISALLSLLVAVIFLIGLVWCVGDEQYQDMESSRQRMLFDDDVTTAKQK